MISWLSLRLKFEQAAASIWPWIKLFWVSHHCQFDNGMHSRQSFVILQGEYYNQDEVQAMVTAEVLEEEKKKREDTAQIEAAASPSKEPEEAEKVNTSGISKKKRRRGGPMVAAWIQHTKKELVTKETF